MANVPGALAMYATAVVDSQASFTARLKVQAILGSA